MDRAKKDCILRAAGKAFTRLGFKKASVDEIAREAGVAKGTVYLACESKEDLFYQTVHREVRAWVAEISRLIDPRVPADQLLFSAAQAGVAYLDQRPLVRELLFGRMHAMLPKWTDRLDELRALGQANVVEILRLGVKQGRFHDRLDLEETARLLQDLQLATLVFDDRKRPGREERLARRGKAAFDLVLDGLRVRQPQAPTHPSRTDAPRRRS